MKCKKQISFMKGGSILVAAVLNISIASAQTENPKKYSPPANSSTELAWTAGRAFTDVSESYRAKFSACDKDRCSSDKNNVEHLLNISGNNAAIIYQSKMSLDMDGGYFPCVYRPKWPNQCGTSFKFDETQLNKDYARDQKRYGDDWKIRVEKLRRYFGKLFVNADTLPYVVAPGGNKSDFSQLTKIKTGDVGVIIFNNKVVPVIVADRGPTFRLGEASLRVFEDLGIPRCTKWTEGSPRYCLAYRNYSQSSGVTTILFPNSTIQPSDVTPATINAAVRTKALEHYDRLKRNIH